MLSRFNFTLRRVAPSALSASAVRPYPVAYSGVGPARSFGAAPEKPSADQVADRVINVLKAYEKIDANAEIRSDANFSDLGLDSLDAQDVILAMEDEFAIEIPDEAADKISGVKSAVSYLITNPHIK